MKIILASKNKLIEQILPKNIEGNYWVKDYDENGQNINLINIEAENNKWCMKSNYQVKIINNESAEEKIYLEEGKKYNLIVENSEIAKIYCMPLPNENMEVYEIIDKNEIKIGKNENCEFIDREIEEPKVFKFIENKWTFTNTNNTIKVYVNKKEETNTILEEGDIVFVNGIIILFFNDKLITNANVISSKLKKIDVAPRTILPIEYYEEENFLEAEQKFHRSPRFRTIIEPFELKIDAPPSSDNSQKELPAIVTLGPMITMGLTSSMMAVSTIVNMVEYNRKIWQVLPSLVMSIGMFSTMVIWPIITRKVQKKLKERERNKTEQKYLGYLENKKELINKTITEQSRILNENYINLEECKNIILNENSNLWERSIEQEDFLKIRLGLGQLDLIGKIEYPEDSFSTSEDNLRKAMEELKANTPKLDKVPITISLTEKNIVGIIVGKELKQKTITSLMLQLLAFHSYEFLKIVILTDKENENYWKGIQIIPHLWNNIKTERYYSTTIENGKELSMLLEKEYQERKANDRKTYQNYGTYYLIITDNYNLYRDLDIVRDILSQETNKGFSLISIARTLSHIPSECQTFISIGQKTSGIVESEINKDNQIEFVSDFINKINMSEIYTKIANIPIEITNTENMLPQSLSFLEMYDSGKIEQLNIKNRWEEANSVVSLAAPIGVDKNNMIINLDLHEKYHGPHGLIAGMTGSGKSEFIITYILSLAVNYSPEEVSFILIDYKGGGLAKVFEDKNNNRILPHVAGTITNLDSNEISRALASIESELKRRQTIFNEARSITGESTIDIYKYQKLYKEGKLKKAVSHLFIICDEFAELKSDQPEFMQQLISTARIGRSLGVHLILATQKPAGVVNDQIWSNSRFRVCLKVQDKYDSNEMIKCPDAATITNIGRFYLQVGYNELFILGQAAYCGAPYFPTEKIRKKIDNSVKIIDNVGNALVSIEPNEDQNKNRSQGEQLVNIINHIIEVAKELHLNAERLWLEKLEERIYTKDLKEKYRYKKVPYNINIFMGEYDDPQNQRRGIVNLPLTEKGNTILFGNAENGRDLMLSTIILEMCINYSTEELNMYICDMGGETLKQYKNMPQVGDVVFVNDQEKINNLFKYLEIEIEKRKKLFADYNGTYQNYIEKSNDKLPNIVVIINDYDTFTEAYSKYAEILSSMTRDSAKHGILFILTADTNGSVRGRIRQNFPQNIVLKFNNSDQYLDFFGFRTKVKPADIMGRGIIKYDSVYEYQTARVFEDKTFNDNVIEMAEKLKLQNNKKVKPIPVLPEKIYPELLIENINENGIPIAMKAETIEIINYDFKKQLTTNIVSNNFLAMKKFIIGLIEVISRDEDICLYILDFSKILNEITIKDYYKENFDNAIEKLNKVSEYFKTEYNQNNKDKNSLNKYKNYLVVMLNASQLETSITDESKILLKNIIEITNKTKKVSFIMVDEALKLSKMETNENYGQLVKKEQYIWYGPGITEQYNYKASLSYEETKRKIIDTFGYIINKEEYAYVKYVEGEENGQ